MGSIPLPALSVKPPADPTEGIKTALSLKSMMMQQASQMQEQQARALEIQRAKQQQADQQTYQQALASTNGDTQSALKLIAGKVNPQSYNAFLKSDADTRKELSEKDTKDFDLLQKKHAAMADLYQQAINLPDQQYAQAWPQIASRANELEPKMKLDPNQPIPKQNLSQFGIGLSVSENYIKSEAEKRAAEKAPLEQQKLEADTAKASADAQKTKLEADYIKQYGYMTPGMAESRYLSVQGKVNQGMAVSPDDKAFKAAYEKNKTLVPAATFNLNNAGANPGSQTYQDNVNGVATGKLKIENVITPRTPLSIRQQFLSDVMNANPNFKASDFDIEKGVAKSFTSGKVSDELNAYNTAIAHADLLKSAADAMNNGNVRVLNSIGNKMGVQFGSDKKTNFDIIRNAYTAEVTKALTSGHITDTELGKQGGTMPDNASPAQIAGAVNSYKALMASKKQQRMDQYEAGKNAQPNFGGSQASGGKIVVVAPDGSKHPFDTQAQADAFKKLANIQ